MTPTPAELTALLIGGFFATLILTICVLGVSIYLNYKKRQALIEEGAYDHATESVFDELGIGHWTDTHTLASGLLVTAIGSGATVERLLANDPLNGSIIFLAIGLALLVLYHKTPRPE